MKKNAFWLIVVLTACSQCLLGPSVKAQDGAEVAPRFFEGLEYRSVGPTRGGRVTAVTGIPEEPFTFYMGATGGGVWKTLDAGTTWENVSDGQIKVGSIGAIAVAPSDPNVVYVGTGSACPRGNISTGIGMYRSTDAGRTWETAGLTKAGQIGKIQVHPQNPEIVYVAALGQIFGSNPERGVYRSEDGGRSWEQVLFVSDQTGAIDILMNPKNPRELYAAFWRAERKPWTLIDGGMEGGIWKSVDGGNNWKKLSGGLPEGLLGKIGLAQSPVNPQRVWAIIQAKEEDQGGLYRTDDGGENWQRVGNDHELRQRGWYYSHLTAHPTDENTLYSCNVSFYKSIDGGKTFGERISVPHGDTHILWINPDNPEIMIQGNDGGACISLTGGKTWSTQNNQPTSEFYRLTVDQQFPYRLYAGQQDNSTISVPSHDPGGVTPYQHWMAVGGSESGDVGVHPENPNIIWAGSYSGEISIMNRATGQIREVTAYPHYTEGTEQRKLKYRWQWNFPILVSRYNPQEVYYTSNYVHRTTNDGQSWERISPDLTRQLDKYHDIPGGPIQHDATGVEVYSSIFAFEESPHQAGEFWAGSDDGLLHISRDGGKTWKDITPRGLPEEGTINKIELSVHQPGRAFVAVYNYRYNDFKPYLYRTEDYGKSWTLLTKEGSGIPNDHFVRAIAEDPETKGLLFAGTEFGMYVSFNDGKNWQSLQLNLPHVPITDMEITGKDLVLSTQGRAFWILDDISVLQQLTGLKQVNQKHLFKPRSTYRTNVRGYAGTVHFYLPFQPEKGDLSKLEIRKPDGTLVRTYSSKSDNKLDRLSVKQGLNSFSWNLRYSGPELVEDLRAMVIRNPSPGPYAAPGDYLIRLQIGKWEASDTLTVLPDPRWKDVTAEDYKAQEEMTIAIRDLITESHKRIINLRTLREQVNEKAKLAVQAGHSKEFTSLAKSIAQKLTAVEDQLIQNRSKTSQDNINFPRVFTNHIGRLYSVVVNDHHRPTGGAHERYEDLKVEYAGIVADYDQVIREEVPRFNALLKKEQVAELIVPEKL